MGRHLAQQGSGRRGVGRRPRRALGATAGRGEAAALRTALPDIARSWSAGATAATDRDTTRPRSAAMRGRGSTGTFGWLSRWESVRRWARRCARGRSTASGEHRRTGGRLRRRLHGFDQPVQRGVHVGAQVHPDDAPFSSGQHLIIPQGLGGDDLEPLAPRNRLVRASSATSWMKTPVLGPPLCNWPVEWRKRGPNPSVVASRVAARTPTRSRCSRSSRAGCGLDTPGAPRNPPPARGSEPAQPGRRVLRVGHAERNRATIGSGASTRIPSRSASAAESGKRPSA